MTRRWALAAALLLTAIFGFVVIAYGSSAGVFAWADGGAQNNAAQPPSIGQATPAPPVMTDVVVVDPANGQPLEPDGQALAEGAASFASDDHEGDGEHDDDHEHEEEHEHEHDDDD